MTGMPPGARDSSVLNVIRGVRRRWRLKVLLRGIVLAGLGGTAMFLIATFAMDQFRFAPAVVMVARIVAWTVVGGLVAWLVVRPLLRRVSDERVALYIEEHEPSVHASILSALAVEGDPGVPVSPALTQRMIEDALERCRRIAYGRRIEQRSLYRSSGTLAGLAVAGAALVLLNPSFLGNGIPFLLFPWGSTPATNPYAVTVAPGDTLLARGSDQLITANLAGFEAERVDVVVRRDTAGTWERFEMTVGAEPGSYEIFLFDLDVPTDYYVEASGVRSRMFRIDVADLPSVRQIDLEYRFPAYAGLAPRTVEDGGDIAALRGTRVRLLIQPTIPVERGQLVVDGEDGQDLVLMDDGRLTATLVVGRETYYRIRLEGVGGRIVPASPDYSIEPLDDQPPTIEMSRPGRDTKVTSIEEAFVEVRAEDDFGVGSLEVIYAVNGGPEDTVVLFQGRPRRKTMTAGHTFFLEELDLAPGDLVSYYGRVRDNRRGTPNEAATDIYFMEVRPFRRDYRQADQQGGGGGGGDDLDGTLSVQQRQVVSATYRVVRDRETYAADDFNENVATLALAQGRIRERVEAIVRRLTDRGVAQGDSAFRQILDELPLAVEAMGAAEEAFGRREPGEALPHALQALQRLQRADAAFRDVQVSRGNPAGGGGGGGGAAAEDLADLFELELDKMRNQYETVQRSRTQQVDEEVDETLQQLRELARRQQQENERMRQRAQALQQGQAGGGGRSQRQLADDVEEMARKLERLSREQSLPDLERSARELRQAADAMRRAAASGTNTAEGRNALERLRDAGRRLEETRAARLDRDVADAVRRVKALQQQQTDMVDEVADLPERGPDRGAAIQRLRERKDAMTAELQSLESGIDAMAREARRDQPGAARSLEEGARSMRDNRLSEKIRYSRGVIAGRSREYARNFEEQIANNLDELRQHLEAAREQIGESADQQLERSLERTRDLVRDLESLRDRVAREADSGSPGPEGAPGQASGERQGNRPSASGSSTGQRGAGAQPGSAGQGGGGGFGADARTRGGARLDPGDIRQFRREFRERRSEAERLQEDLRGQGIEVEALAGILDRLRALDRARTYNDPEEIRRLEDAVIEGLKEFEFILRRQLLGVEDGALTLSGSDDVPEGYRKMVEEYYRDLSRVRHR